MTVTARPIALLTRVDSSSTATWAAALSAAMPDETILPFSAMSEEQKQATEIAIVANPDPAQVASLPQLRFIHSLWAGVERLVAELGPTAPPIVRLTDPELSRVMAEAVLAWTFYIQRDMPAYRIHQNEGRWEELPYRRPSDLTVGLLGLGALGSVAARRLQDAGFNTIGWSRSPRDLPGVETFPGESGLETLLGRSDIIVCLVPLTARTRGLLDARRLSQIKAGAAIINFARGPIIVSADLLSALDSGHISHAVLDVFDEEPLQRASPFWKHPKVTVLPHISAPTDTKTAARIVSENIRNWRERGIMPETVDRERGY